MKVALHGRRLRLVLAAGVVALACAAVAAASTFTAGTLVRAPDMPLAGASAACAARVAASTAAGSVNYPDAEVEPHVTVDPTKPQHLDRACSSRTAGTTAARTGDHRRRLERRRRELAPRARPAEVHDLPGSDTGLAGLLRQATDPWVSFSSDGKIVYAIADSFNANGPAFGGASAILVSRSTRRRRHWQTPVTARFDASTTVLNDKETVTGGSDRAEHRLRRLGSARLAEPERQPGAFNVSPAFRGPTMFSKTTDGGVTWSQGRVDLRAGPEEPDHWQPDRRPDRRAGGGRPDQRFQPDHSTRAAKATTSARRSVLP